MKKVFKTVVAVSAVLAASVSAYELFEMGGPASFPPRASELAISPDAGSGPFYIYDDSNEDADGCVAGTSSVTNNPPDASTEEDVFASWMEAQEGKISFSATNKCSYSFVGVGFKWIDTGSDQTNGGKAWNPVTAEDGDAEGISVCFDNKTENMAIELSVTDDVANATGWSVYHVILPTTEGPTHQKIAWTDFEQYSHGTAVAWDDYIVGSTGIQFKFNGGGTNVSGDFYLYGVGWYNDDPDGCRQVSPIIPVNRQAGFSLTQHGRTLTFSGLSDNNIGTVEVINMQGKLVSKAEISSTAPTMSLNNLSTGIYMVRANNYTQKIIIK